MRPKHLLLALIVWLACCPLAQAATKSRCLLIVADEHNKTMMRLENEMVEIVRSYLADEKIPQKSVPILVYHFNKPSERAYCEQKLGLKKSDLVFLGLAEMKGLVVTRVILRYNRVENARAALNTLFERLSADLGKPAPHPTRTTIVDRVPDTPEPSPTSGEVNIFRVQTCRAVRNGQPQGLTDVFDPHDTFYVYMSADNVRSGMVFQVVWHYGEDVMKMVNGGPATSKYTVKTPYDGFYVYFYLEPPKTSDWRSGRYHVDIMVDGKLQTTAYFRVQ